MMSRSFNGKYLAILGALLLVFYVGYRIYESRLDAAALADQTKENAIPTVALVRPTPLPKNDTITLPGNLVGWYEAQTYARVTGYVKMWYKSYGDYVKKGDLLAKINAPNLDAKYRQAVADMESERAKYALSVITAKRYQRMRKSHAVSEQAITIKEKEMLAHKALLKAAQQRVKNVGAFIRFKKIVAPFDGVVIRRNINVGDLVSKEGTLSTPGAKTNLFTVAVVDRLRLFVHVPERFGPFLKPGMTADLTVPQLPGRRWTAKFLNIAKGFEENTRTATTIFIIENEDHALWPGSYAKVHLSAPIERHAFTMPSTAMVFQEHNTQVAVLTEDDRVHLKDITVSKLMDQYVEVSEGLSADDRIINNPSAALLEGDEVRVVTPAPGYDLINSSASRLMTSPEEGPQSSEELKSSGGPKSSEAPIPDPVRTPPQARQQVQP